MDKFNVFSASSYSHHSLTMAQGMRAADDVHLPRQAQSATAAALPGSAELPEERPTRRWGCCCSGFHGWVLSWIPCWPGRSNVAERAVSGFPKDSLFVGCRPRLWGCDERAATTMDRRSGGGASGAVSSRAPPGPVVRDRFLEQDEKEEHKVPSDG